MNKIPITATDWYEKIKAEKESELTDENKVILKYFFFALRDTNILANCDYSSISATWEYIWQNQIIIDNVSHVLIARGKKCSVQEILKATTANICKKLGTIVLPVALSLSQVKYLEQNNLKLPERLTEIPISLPTATSILDTGMVVVDFMHVASQKLLYRYYYTTEILLETARKKIEGGRVYNIVITKKGEIKTPATGPWNAEYKSDSIEMLIKTAVRKSMKYFINLK